MPRLEDEYATYDDGDFRMTIKAAADQIGTDEVEIELWYSDSYTAIGVPLSQMPAFIAWLTAFYERAKAANPAS